MLFLQLLSCDMFCQFESFLIVESRLNLSSKAGSSRGATARDQGGLPWMRVGRLALVGCFGPIFGGALTKTGWWLQTMFYSPQDLGWLFDWLGMAYNHQPDEWSFKSETKPFATGFFVFLKWMWKVYHIWWHIGTWKAMSCNVLLIFVGS